MIIKVPHKFLEIEYTFYTNKYLKSDNDFNLSHYNEIKKELINSNSDKIRIKASKDNELKKFIKEHLNIQNIDNIHINCLFNCANICLKGQRLDVHRFEQLVNHFSKKAS